MFDPSAIYRPVTARSGISNETYMEVEPCGALKPYIRCFWGTPKPRRNTIETDIKQSLVIPDTCMDIIFNIDIDSNEVDDLFSGINLTSFFSPPQNGISMVSTFGVRFYSWAVPLFADESMSDALNAYIGSELYFHTFKNNFRKILINNPSIYKRAEEAEIYLLKKMDLNRLNQNVMNTVYMILKSRGTAKITELSDYIYTGRRQLERLFNEYVGVSPKRLSGLIRYQYLWQEILNDKHLDIQNAVYKYGYSDQSHLLNDFKKYHTMTPAAARALAIDKR